MTFDELLGPKATPQEREALAWHLACFRQWKTYDALRMSPDPEKPEASDEIRK